MALPKLLQKLFANDGVGPLLRSDIMPIKTVNGVSPNSSGDVVVNDYVTKLSVSGKTITYTKKDGSTGTITTQDTVYSHPSTHPASMITGLATVATSGSYNDLSNKPMIPATPEVYVTTTWKRGNNWYRVWSNGFIEQGGYINQPTNYGSMTISLNKAFSTKYYNITIMPISISNNGTFFSCFGYERNTSSVKYLNGGTPCSWYACGY